MKHFTNEELDELQAQCDADKKAREALLQSNWLDKDLNAEANLQKRLLMETARAAMPTLIAQLRATTADLEKFKEEARALSAASFRTTPAAAPEAPAEAWVSVADAQLVEGHLYWLAVQKEVRWVFGAMAIARYGLSRQNGEEMVFRKEDMNQELCLEDVTHVMPYRIPSLPTPRHDA